MMATSRRRFLHTVSASGLAAHQFGFLSQLPQVSAKEAKLDSGVVRFDNDLEPLVRLIEQTSRETLLEKVAERIRGGATYRDVLASLLLAGIRNVQPRPSVGFKFHCVLVVNSCHLASLYGPDEDRWLPLFWGLNYFKSSQADEARRSGWRMKPVNESLVPKAPLAQKMFIEAMDKWDVEKADAATAGVVRNCGATEVFNLFSRYAARDYRSIGHKAIYLANAWRTLQVIGWRHAEPVMRSLAFALLNHNGQSNPATSDLDQDRPWRENAEKLDRIPDSWLAGKAEAGVATELFNTFRQGDPGAASDAAVEALAKGLSPHSVWDGVFVGAGELLMRQPGIIGLHGLTTANAMHFLWKTSADDALRRQLLLQACSFNPMFRESAKGRGKLTEDTADGLEPLESEGGESAVDEILTDISRDRKRAARKVLGYLDAGGSSAKLVNASRRALFLKGRDAHDYKFSSAVLEDYRHVSPQWRDRFLALSVFNLKGSGHRNSDLLDRTRAAFE